MLRPRRLNRAIEWTAACGEAVPLGDASVDAVEQADCSVAFEMPALIITARMA
jgi:hypothetical protein